jgi:hypothetical protein
MVVFRGDFRQCPPVVSRGFRVAIVSTALSRSILWREVRILILMENMRLCVNPLSWPYVEYLLRVENGQKFSIIDHFPLKADAKPLVRIKIALYPKIHQAPSLDTFIHDVFLTLAINYVNQGYMDNRAILTTKNTFMNYLNTQIVEVCLGESTYFYWQTRWKLGTTRLWRLARNFSTPLLGRYATTSPSLQSWHPCYLTKKSRCGLGTL